MFSDTHIVTVYRTSDPALIALTKSLLDSAGIEYMAKGEGVQDFFAMGRAANNFNIVVGPVEIQVAEKDAVEASALLKDLETNVVALPDDDEAFFTGDCEVREETREDLESIHEIHAHAFRRSAESKLVDLLREHRQALISLVAVCGDEVAGHVMFSPITVDTSFTGFRAAGLGPLAVRSEYQNNGIGSTLVMRGIEECRRNDYDAIFVLGNPDFWERFGFVQASNYGLTSQYNAEHSFLVLELKPGTLARLKGLVRYAAEFEECGC